MSNNFKRKSWTVHYILIEDDGNELEDQETIQAYNAYEAGERVRESLVETNPDLEVEIVKVEENKETYE